MELPRIWRDFGYIKKKKLLNEFPIPPVDTHIIYRNYQNTDICLVYDQDKKEKTNFDDNEVLATGGDVTMNNYSIMLVGNEMVIREKNEKIFGKILI